MNDNTEVTTVEVSAEVAPVGDNQKLTTGEKAGVAVVGGLAIYGLVKAGQGLYKFGKKTIRKIKESKAVEETTEEADEAVTKVKVKVKKVVKKTKTEENEEE